MNRLARPIIATALLALLVMSMVIARGGDDFAAVNHHTFNVVGVAADSSVQLDNGEGVQLLGVADPEPAAREWLIGRLANQTVTLLLEPPQTRDDGRRIRASVFVGNENINVELIKAGLAYADRREKTIFDGLLDPAEADARKEKRGLWQHGGNQVRN
jgi:endonuclease YncB( thermonuclease family)